MNPSHHSPSATLKATLLLSKIYSKNNLDYIKLQVVQKDRSHPTGPYRLLFLSIVSLSRNFHAQSVHQQFVHPSYQRILQMAKLWIYTGLPKPIPKLSHPCRTCIIAKGPCLPHHPNVSTENIDPGTCFHHDFSYFNKVSCRNFASSLIIVDATTSYLFVYSARSKRLTLQLIKTFIQLSCHLVYKISIFRVD